MRFLSKLLGQKISNENTTKPFHMNKNADERRDWFMRTRPWHNVNPRLISELVEKFGDDPMFEVFVITSMELRLVHFYETLGKQGYVEGVGCTQVSAILCKVGMPSVDALKSLLQASSFSEKKMSHHYGIVRNTLESAICLDDNQLAAYMGLANVYAMLNKREDCLSIAQKGLEKAKSLKAQKIPFHMSKVVSQGQQSIEQMESAFSNLISHIS
ncbi:MAG: hypothetical protein LRZ85_08520 [Alphaproteobacteria bacterium]|nr:hypothetical protein [Alphaproteobacteria bacterium]